VELNQALASYERRASELRIITRERSRYILNPVGPSTRAEFNGGYLEFHLMIENTGRRNSTVNRYQVEIFELQQVFSDLVPVEGRNGIQGRHCQHGMQPNRILSTSGIVRIDAERVADHDILLFFVPGITLERFTDAGLQMSGENRKFGTLRCRLTLTDTTQSSVSHEFQLHEE